MFSTGIREGLEDEDAASDTWLSGVSTSATVTEVESGVSSEVCWLAAAMVGASLIPLTVTGTEGSRSARPR